MSAYAIRDTSQTATHHSIGTGSPLNQSGMNILCFWLWLLVARMSAPCSVCLKKPKMSKIETMPFSASSGPVTSAKMVSQSLRSV